MHNYSIFWDVNIRGVMVEVILFMWSILGTIFPGAIPDIIGNNITSFTNHNYHWEITASNINELIFILWTYNMPYLGCQVHAKL